ncbi:hypothetical protein [Sinorhizobium medicae]|uniref:hypothetical protein n=1 Tax=Sinorhizobium medicae TaxID=110321 RepID=UPI000FD71975|nr:hypothetical protein [Sinorhizobium medicae]RVJ82620.1 hypothetical protein CN168_10425 [Sinorhizobium medicae]
MLDDLRADVTAALTGTLRSGTLRREVDGGQDEYGNPLPGVVTNYPFEGIRGSYDAQYAGMSGIPREAAKIEILAASITVEPARLDVLTIEGAWWLIVNIEVDPAGSWFVCQCQATVSPA